MKAFIIITLMALSQFALAENCVSTLKEGSHSAPNETDARVGAYEDSDEQCYPGEATELSINCEPTTFNDGERDWHVVRCVREVQCMYCGDVLEDKAL